MDFIPLDHAEELLIKVGRVYGIQAGRDEVQRALADAENGPAFAEWATLHLGSDHLLTADELALYTALDKSGEVDQLAALHDLSDVQAVSEEEIRAAIEELNRSTANITKQSETLRQQQDALSRIVKKGAENGTRRQALEEDRNLRAESAQKRVAAEVEDMLQTLEYRISDLEQQSKDVGTQLEETVDGLLKADDKLLSSLQKLGWELEKDDPETEENVEKMREICMRLIKNTVETVRTKLDRIYLETIVNAERSGESKPGSAGEVKALEEELESLYTEILPVAQMSAEQEYLEPAFKSTTSRSLNGLERSVAAVSYINDCLDYLLERISCMGSRVDEIKSHQLAASSILSTAIEEMTMPTDVAEKPSQQQFGSASPGKPSPIRSRANTLNSRNRRSSSAIFDEPAMEVLQRSLALTISSSEDAQIQVNLLAQTLADRTTKAEDVARNVQDSFESTTVSKMDDMRKAIQNLRDSVLAETPYEKVQLTDSEIEDSILFLEQEVEKLKGQLDEVEGKRLAMKKSVKREEFLQRWGS